MAATPASEWQRPEPFATVAPRLGFVGAFDGFRGIGVALVMLAHVFPAQTSSFQPIVDGFFVISAFLIMSLLFQEHGRNGRIDFKRFFARRAIRLLPNSYACMAVWMGLWVLGAVLVDRNAEGIDKVALEQFDAIPGNVAAAGLYVYHLVYPQPAEVGPLNQFWSLSVEEQFYGVVSLLVAWMLVSRRRVAWACGVLAAGFVVIGWQRFNVDLGPWPGKLYDDDIWTRGLRSLWTARPDAFFIGALAAVVNALMPDPLPPKVQRIVVWLGTACGIGMVLVLLSSLRIGLPALPGLPHHVKNGTSELLCQAVDGGPYAPCTDRMWLIRWVYTTFSVLCGPWVICVARAKDCGMARFMSWKPFRFVGERSYSLYVWHILAFLIAEMVIGGVLEGAGLNKDGTAGHAVSIAGRLVAGVVVGFAAHRFIDVAMLRFKLRFASEDVVLDRTTGMMVAPPSKGAGSHEGGT